MSIIAFYGQILKSVDTKDGLPIEHSGDLYWYRAKDIKSEPDWNDKRLGLHDKNTCCGYFRIVYSYFLNAPSGGGRKEAHSAYCGDCAKELIKFLPHKITKEKIETFAIPFGKYTGVSIEMVPKDYLQWAAKNFTNGSIKRKIQAYLEDAGGTI